MQQSSVGGWVDGCGCLFCPALFLFWPACLPACLPVSSSLSHALAHARPLQAPCRNRTLHASTSRLPSAMTMLFQTPNTASRNCSASVLQATLARFEAKCTYTRTRTLTHSFTPSRLHSFTPSLLHPFTHCGRSAWPHHSKSTARATCGRCARRWVSRMRTMQRWKSSGSGQRRPGLC